MNLSSNIFVPYKKEQLKCKYINKESNHPKLVRKGISSMVNKRLINLSIRYLIALKVIITKYQL